MMSLASMLNPVDDQGLPSPATTRATTSATPEPYPPAKKQKLAKDAPIFAKGKPVGKVNFPPFEIFSILEKDEMDKHEIYPQPGRIMEYPRHIPYSSDKKSFLQKTGRDAFEVFQYTFRIPGKDHEYVVMWDYQIGLVRITPFFKSLELPKTVPGKMLQSNPGLKEVCHSITGGALAAQGYWMPFNAAKAVAATFCWPLRYALLPLFGPDFADKCVDKASQLYKRMIIDRSIIEDCTREASSYPSFSPAPSFSTLSSTPHFTQPRYDVSSPRSNNSHIDYPRRRWNQPAKLVELDRRNGMFSPAQTKHHISQQPAAALRVNTTIPRSHPSDLLPSPKTLKASRMLIDACSAPPNSPTSPGDSSDSDISPRTISVRPTNIRDESVADEMNSICDDGVRDRLAKMDPRGPEIKAAWQLLQLHMADASMRDRRPSPPRGTKRRAST